MEISPSAAAWRPGRGPKILILSRHLPIPNSMGSATHMLDFIRYLSACGCRLEYALLEAAPTTNARRRVIPPAVSRVTRVSIPGHWNVGSSWLIPKTLPGRILRRLRVRPPAGRNAPDAALRYDSPATAAERTFIRERVARFKPAVIIADYSWLANVFADLPTDQSILRVVFVHDLRWRTLADLEKAGILGQQPSGWTWEKEAALLRQAQLLLVLQAEDAAVLAQMAPEAKAVRISVSVAIQDHSPAEQVSGRCLYVSSDTDENVTALLWFLRSAWPLVLQSRPDAQLHVCGNVCRQIRELFPKTRLLGRIDALEREYGASEVCLVPHIIHGGIKLKLVDALAHGRAVVASPCGIDGLPEVAAGAGIVAETPEAFAAAVVSVLNNPARRQQMERAAHHLAQTHLSPAAAYGPFVRELQTLA